MAWVASGVGLAVGLYGADQQAQAASNAAEGQQQASDLTLAEMKRQFDLQQNQMYPYAQAGENSLAEIMALMGLGGDTEAANRALFESPEYRFAEEQGRRQLEGGLATRGGMQSGKAMTAATQFGQNLATSTRGNRLSDLFKLTGIGQSSASNMGSAGTNYAGNMGNVLMGNANAQGAAGMAGANARVSGLLGGAQLGLNAYDYFNNPRSSVMPELNNTALSKVGSNEFSGPSYLNPTNNNYGSGSNPSWWSNVYGTNNFGQGGSSNNLSDMFDLYQNPYEQYL